jgi:predicted Rossmann fold flavoprotein
VPSDYFGADRKIVARVLQRFGVEKTIGFFAELGVGLKHEPEFDKLFPVTDDAHTILDALVGECERLGCAPIGNFRVETITRETAADGSAVFVVTSFADASGEVQVVRARRVVLAMGGKALPKSGSDGHGYAVAQSLGHTVTTTVPALVPLVLQPNPFGGLEGIAFPVEIRVWAGGKLAHRVSGPMLVTHFGISGPVALDVSRHWTTAAAAGTPPRLALSVFPGRESNEIDAEWIALAGTAGTRPAGSLLSHLPHRVVYRLLEVAGVHGAKRCAELTRESRSRLVAAATDLTLPVTDSRGFTTAEVTAGGVPVAEIDVRTMESKRTPGLYFVGEILEVEGRLGGFNFQWAWATGFVAGQALAVAAK